jgi:hypothetical protein
MNRPLYRPSQDELLKAIEILLASDIPTEARRFIRQMEQEMSKKRGESGSHH